MLAVITPESEGHLQSSHVLRAIRQEALAGPSPRPPLGRRMRAKEPKAGRVALKAYAAIWRKKSELWGSPGTPKVINITRVSSTPVAFKFLPKSAGREREPVENKGQPGSGPPLI